MLLKLIVNSSFFYHCSKSSSLLPDVFPPAENRRRVPCCLAEFLCVLVLSVVTDPFSLSDDAARSIVVVIVDGKTIVVTVRGEIKSSSKLLGNCSGTRFDDKLRIREVALRRCDDEVVCPGVNCL